MAQPPTRICLSLRALRCVEKGVGTKSAQHPTGRWRPGGPTPISVLSICERSG